MVSPPIWRSDLQHAKIHAGSWKGDAASTFNFHEYRGVGHMTFTTQARTVLNSLFQILSNFGEDFCPPSHDLAALHWFASTRRNTAHPYYAFYSLDENTNQ